MPQRSLPDLGRCDSYSVPFASAWRERGDVAEFERLRILSAISPRLPEVPCRPSWIASRSAPGSTRVRNHDVARVDEAFDEQPATRSDHLHDTFAGTEQRDEVNPPDQSIPAPSTSPPTLAGGERQSKARRRADGQSSREDTFVGAAPQGPFPGRRLTSILQGSVKQPYPGEDLEKGGQGHQTRWSDLTHVASDHVLT